MCRFLLQPNFEPTAENMGLRMRCRQCEGVIPEKKVKGFNKKLSQ